MSINTNNRLLNLSTDLVLCITQYLFVPEIESICIATRKPHLPKQIFQNASYQSLYYRLIHKCYSIGFYKKASAIINMYNNHNVIVGNQKKKMITRLTKRLIKFHLYCNNKGKKDIDIIFGDCDLSVYDVFIDKEFVDGEFKHEYCDMLPDYNYDIMKLQSPKLMLLYISDSDNEIHTFVPKLIDTNKTELLEAVLTQMDKWSQYLSTIDNPTIYMLDRRYRDHTRSLVKYIIDYCKKVVFIKTSI